MTTYDRTNIFTIQEIFEKKPKNEKLAVSTRREPVAIEHAVRYEPYSNKGSPKSKKMEKSSLRTPTSVVKLCSDSAEKRIQTNLEIIHGDKVEFDTNIAVSAAVRRLFR